MQRGNLLWIVVPSLLIVLLAYTAHRLVGLVLLPTLLILLISIVVPIRIVGVTKRWAAVLSFIGIVFSFAAVGTRLETTETERLAHMQKNNPEAYAEHLAKEDERKAAEEKRVRIREAEETAKAAAKWREDQAKRQEQNSKAQARRQAENEKKKNGFHCLSAWDGSHTEFKRDVRSMMRNPKSFEHIETRVTPVSDGRHTIIMRYRAENGFGGMTAGTASGYYSNGTCSHIVTEVE